MKKPTIEEIQAYIDEKNVNVDAEDFFDYNEKRGWTVGQYGKAPMKCWKAAVRTCARHGYAKTTASTRHYEQRNSTSDNKQYIHDQYSDYLRAKSTKALQDLIKDPGQLKHAVWLIEEILTERQCG